MHLRQEEHNAQKTGIGTPLCQRGKGLLHPVPSPRLLVHFLSRDNHDIHSWLASLFQFLQDYICNLFILPISCLPCLAHEQLLSRFWLKRTDHMGV